MAEHLTFWPAAARRGALPLHVELYGETACNQTAQALMPAVQNLVGKVVRDPAFVELVRR
jgi:hypothetical protein